MVFVMIYFFYWAISLCNVNEKQVVSNLYQYRAYKLLKPLTIKPLIDSS